MEVWDILDENGNITGETMCKGDKKVWEEGIYHQGVDAWIINSENKILIQKRSPKKKLEPNVWAMTGGSVIKGETLLEALKRETLEELGIELRVADRRYPSSKICHACGCVKKNLKLSDREYICECGYHADRDYNASLNLRDAKTYKTA